MEHCSSSDTTGGEGNTSDDKPRHSILVNVVTHSCEDEDDLSSSSKSENVAKKHVRFKRSKSLTKSIDSSKRVLKSGRYFGTILSIFAAFQYSLNLLSVKLLQYHPCNLALYRFSITVLLTLAYFVYHAYFFKRKIVNEDGTGLQNSSFNLKPRLCNDKKTASFLFLYSVLNVNSTLFLFYGLTYIDIFNAAVIISSAPVFITFAAWLYLGVRCGVIPVLTAACALLATGIVCQLPIITGDSKWNVNLITGTIYCFTSMLLLTFHQVIATRHLKSVHHVAIKLSVAVYGLVQTGLIAYIFNLLSFPKSLHEIALVTAGALLEAGAQIFVTCASKYEQMEIVLVIKAVAEIVSAFTCQALFFPQQQYFIYSIIGAALMLASVILTLLRNIVLNLPENHNAKQCLSCLSR